MPHKEMLTITIRAKGKGEIDSFTAPYSMKEEFDDLPIIHGEAVAEYVHNLVEGEYIVQVSVQIPDKVIEELKTVLDIDNKTKGQLIADRIGNPMKSCFSAYRKIALSSCSVMVKQVSIGYCCAVVVPEWVQERGGKSNI